MYSSQKIAHYLPLGTYYLLYLVYTSQLQPTQVNDTPVNLCPKGPTTSIVLLIVRSERKNSSLRLHVDVGYKSIDTRALLKNIQPYIPVDLNHRSKVPLLRI